MSELRFVYFARLHQLRFTLLAPGPLDFPSAVWRMWWAGKAKGG